MNYPYTNDQLLDMFSESKEVSFVKFLQDLEEKIEEIPPCEICRINREPNCGNEWCPTRNEETTKKKIKDQITERSYDKI